MNDDMILNYTICIHDEGSDGFWAEVEELPGLFASGMNEAELQEALEEAIGLYLSSDTSQVDVSLKSSVDVQRRDKYSVEHRGDLIDA